MKGALQLSRMKAICPPTVCHTVLLIPLLQVGAKVSQALLSTVLAQFNLLLRIHYSDPSPTKQREVSAILKALLHFGLEWICVNSVPRA